MLVTSDVAKPSVSTQKGKRRSSDQKTSVFYPESDGKPMAETGIHSNLLMELRVVLQYAFPEAHVSGNICLYYEEGNPKKMISPDVLLCRSQPAHLKRIYLAWEPNAQLDLVIELSSNSTKKVDYGKKKQLYANILRVPYYVIFDPEKRVLNAFVLREGEYHNLPVEDGQCTLEDLQISLVIDKLRLLRVLDRYGNPVFTSEERAERAEAHANQAEAHAERAKAHANQAEARANQAEAHANQAEARANQAEAHANQAEAHVEQVKSDAERAEKRAENAEERAEWAEAKVAEKEQEVQSLQEELEALRRQLKD